MPTDPEVLRNMLLSLIRPVRASGDDTLSLPEQIALRIATEIVDGAIAPLARITETPLAERFEVSRGPVREALRILDSTGLVRLLPRRGAVITELSVEDVADLFEVRAVLFGLAAKRFASSRNDKDLLQLEGNVAKLAQLAREAGEEVPRQYAMAVQETGHRICTASGITSLPSMVAGLYFRTLRYSKLGVTSPARRAQSVENWTALVVQIKARDGANAELTARRLVEQSRDEAIRLLSLQ
ncbi:GntR family transcriptional regulator [Sphingorhabdus contaminans]|uniref:GntR family transcriptional regulator n=1 Tax=Sphingorhabdus contaminans TaxID=1343899 RepID=UPI003D286E8B